MLRERHQAQRPHGARNKIPRIGRFIERDSKFVVAGSGIGAGASEGLPMGMEIPSGETKTFLELGGGDGYATPVC